jgi:isoleucyl-tRNA synthetase
MALFPAAEELGAPLEPRQAAAWNSLLGVRSEVLKALEAARQSKQINSSLDAKVVLAAAGETAALLERYRDSLPALFIVSHVELESAGAELAVRVLRADGAKCERCWNYSTRVGEDTRYPTVCERCSAALAEIERERAVPTVRDAGA